MSNAVLPASSIREMIDQYNHRLLSLEVDLQEAARTNQLGVRDYERRAKVISLLRSDLREISDFNTLESTDPFEANDADLGLPITGNCTPAEISVCNEFLDQKLSYIQRLEKDSRKILIWVRDAIAGEVPGYKLVWRLSRLRKMISKTESGTKLLFQESTMVDQYVDKLVRGLGKNIPRGIFARNKTFSPDALRGTIDGLMQVFSDLDGVISRVAKLRATVKNERHRITQMIHWLDVNETEVFSSRPSMAPPSPMATARAMAEIPVIPGLNLELDRKRLGLARGFLKKMVGQASHEAQEPQVRPGPNDIEAENKMASEADHEFDPASILRAIKRGKTAREIEGLF